MARLLVADDDPGTVLLLSHFLRLEGFDVRSAVCSDEALVIAATFEPDAAILDCNLVYPGAGVELAHALRRLSPRLRLVFVSGLEAAELRKRLDGFEVQAFLTKPIELPDLEAVLRQLAL